MATKKELLESGCLQNSAGDEPLFLLCGRDRIAPGLVKEWAKKATALGVKKAKTNEALECFRKMVAWQIMNKSKLPD